VPEDSRRIYLRGGVRRRCVKSLHGNQSVGAALHSQATHHYDGLTPQRLQPCRFISPAAAAPRVRSLCLFTWSSDHAVDVCCWRAQKLQGPPSLHFFKRTHSWARLPGATVGVLDTGVSQSTCSWAPSSAHLQPRGKMMMQAMEKTLTRRCLMRRTMTKTAKDQKTSLRAPAGEERNHAHISSARLCAEQEDNRQKTVFCPRYPQ
jgi:hypothetical protein